MRVPHFAAALLAHALLLAVPVMAESSAVTPAAPEASAAPPQPVILNKNALPADMMPPAAAKDDASAKSEAGPAADEPSKKTEAVAPAEAPAASESAAMSAEDAAEDAAAREFKPDTAAATPEKETAAAAPPPPPAPPSLNIDINLTSQRMTVTEDGQQKYSWAISSARAGYKTPTGTFKPSWMSKMWYSRQYDYAPMPHAIFFSGGTAIHATYATSMLGRPASHGCVRLAPANAATLYKMVNRHGKNMTRIAVHGVPNQREPSIARNKYKSPRYAAVPPGYRYIPGYAPSNPYGYRGYGSSRPRTVYRTYTTPRGYYTKPRRYVQRGYYSSYPY